MLTNEIAELVIDATLEDKDIVGDFEYDKASESFKEFISKLIEDSSHRKSIPDMTFNTSENLITINNGELSEVYHMGDLTELLVVVAITMNIEPLLNTKADVVGGDHVH